MGLEIVYSKGGAKVPAYVSVYETLYEKICGGEYGPGEQLPSENQLTETYGISRGSLRQALAILREDGLIYNVQGKGNFVCKNIDAPPSNFGTLDNPIFSCAKEKPDQVRLFFNYQAPAVVVREKLNLSANEIALVCNAVYFSQDTPTAHAFYEVPAKSMNFQGVDLNDAEQIKEILAESMYHLAATSMARVHITRAEADEVAYLKTGVGEPLLFIEEILYGSKGEPLALCKYYLLPEYYHLNVVRR